MKNFKIVVEKHPDTYGAYPLGLKGVVVGEDAVEIEPLILEAFIAEAGVAS